MRTLDNLPRPAILGMLLAFLTVTMASFANAPAGDAPNYRQIADAAPSLPTETIGSAYTGRIASHYLVGLINDIPGVSLDVAYLVVWAVVVGALMVVIHLLLRPVSVAVYAFCASLLILNPYFLRPYVQQIELLQDLVFVVGLGIALLGLSRVKPELVLAGLVLGLAGRQTALVVAFAVALWMAFTPAWRERFAGMRFVLAAGAVVVVGLLNKGIRALVASFSKPYEPSIPGDTILTRLDELPGNAVELASHFARTAVPLIAVCVVFAAAALIVGLKQIPAESWAAMVVAASIVAQPAVIDPAWVGFMSNEQRLSVLALLPAVLGLGLLLAKLNFDAISPLVVVAAGVLLAIGSLHHLFTSVGPDGLGTFLVVQFVVAAGLGTIVVLNRRKLEPQPMPLESVLV